VSNVIKDYSPCGIHPTPFYHSDPQTRKLRSDFAEEFLSARNEGSAKLFLAEGVSFIFKNFVSFYTDMINDSSSGMNDKKP
jgi:hypothetical protein